MQTVSTVGLDIAKSAFQVHGVDNHGEVVIRLLPDRLSNPGCAANAVRSGDPRERRRCSAWRYGAVYKDWCRSLGALPFPNAGKWLGSTPAGCEVCREACRNESSALRSGDPRERRRCSAWRYGAVYKEWCRSLGALPFPNAGQWLGSTPAGCEVCREACRNESSALDHGLPTSALDGDAIM